MSAFLTVRCNGHGGHKISTLERKPKAASRKSIFDRCFQWLIKEMKCIMMVRYAIACFAAGTIFDVPFSFAKFFIQVCKRNRSLAPSKAPHCATLTALLWFQNMNAGGSGELCTTQVRFIVEPLSMYKSGAPIISVDGSARRREKKIIWIKSGENQS